MIYQNTFQMAESHTETNISCFHYHGDVSGGYPLHFHTHYEISYVIQGERYEIYNGQYHKVGAGSLFFLPPLSMHGNQNITSVDDLVIQFSMDYLRLATYDFKKDTAILLKDTTNPCYEVQEGTFLHNLLQKITAASTLQHQGEISLPEQISTGLRRTGLIFQMISVLIEEGFLVLQPNHITMSQMTLMDQLLHQIFANPAHIPDMQTAARDIGMSYYGFSRFFKKVTGFGYNEYCNILRLQYTENLLANSDLSIREIANSIGIETASYFSRLFKNHYGMSPMQYRAKYSITKYAQTNIKQD